MNLTEIIFWIVKIAGAIFALMHFLAIIFIWRQISLAVATIRTRSRKQIIFFVLLHAIILFLVFVLIIILPV